MMNPFSLVPIELEIPGFLAWVRSQVSEDYYKKSVRLYAKYLGLLVDTLAFSQMLSLKTPKVRTSIFKVFANFARYLDLRYNTTVFSDYYGLLRKRLRIKWTAEPKQPRRIPSLEELVDIVSIAAEIHINYALYLYLLAISRLRPCEARHLEVLGPITPI